MDLLEATVNKKAPVELTVFIRAGLTDIPSLVSHELLLMFFGAKGGK